MLEKAKNKNMSCIRGLIKVWATLGFRIENPTSELVQKRRTTALVAAVCLK